MLTAEQQTFYNDKGYLHIPGVFTVDEVDALREELDWMIQDWAVKDQGWSGPWREALMGDQAAASLLIAMHDLQSYGVAWQKAVTNARLVESMVDLLGPNVELHHSTTHVKPPENGHLFPLHQDWMFYEHTNDNYVDVLVHLDDTCHENGEIRFLEGSHADGPLPHITETEDGPTTPFLPFEEYRLEDTVAVPAKAGDVVIFNINTVHGSYLNQTDQMRRMVRVGYRDPSNLQTGGQSLGRPGLMVAGRRPRLEGQDLFTTEAGDPAVPV